MNRMDGYLKGTPKVLDSTQLNYNFISEQNGYFIKVKIKGIGKFRQFPFLSKYSEHGVRMFSNDLIDQILYIDKTALEDAILFQDITLEIIDGYYFNEGRNDTIKRVISHLYSKRKDFFKKKSGTISNKRNHE